ncbi:tetratricopeptide repeat protein [Candidatus Magnetaquicoccus inordinatus]|uniref:tetratricopeptide repeat protein n=1 Tax=Candidatus Magnetaquicoccus inordinatus TaxID=2496818 RepID=UPI00102C5C8A|nr:tetratricopeptide repeat protein [Candidatus Magnetaquicoccus inordinatus]
MKNRQRGKAAPRARSTTAPQPVVAVDVQQKLAEVRSCHQQNNFAKALALCEEILASDPQQLEALFLSSNILINLQNFPKARVRIEEALTQQPQQPMLLFNAGVILAGLQEWPAAVEKLRLLVRLQPQHQRGLYLLGHALTRMERWEEAAEILHRSLDLAPEHADSHLLLAKALQNLSVTYYAHYHRRLGSYYAGVPLAAPPTPRHTLFVNREKALQSARAARKVQETIQKAVPQLCYHFGQPFADAPAQLICLPGDTISLMEFFTRTPFTHPEEIDFDPAQPMERQEAKRIVQILYKTMVVRTQVKEEMEKKVRSAAAPATAGEGALRVYIATSRKLDVMLSNSRDLRSAFEQLGCQVMMAMEPDERETFHAIHYLQQIDAFRPHLLIDINNYYKLAVHPETCCVYWYTDPMPVLLRGQPFPWRQKDILYSLNQEFAQLIKNCGGKDVRVQGFCYDQQLFRDYGQARQRKVVFVGSTHDFVLSQYPNPQPILQEMQHHFMAGEPLNNPLLEEYAARTGLPPTEISTFFWGYVVRNVSVRWLCELAGEIPVEIYGHGWEKDPVVRPFYKGSLPHGQAVTDLYNQAEYALVPHPYDLGSQRLVEAAACGIIPVVYDCRYCADPPHWDDNCLWYRRKEQLRQRLQERPAQDSKVISQGRSYLEFAQQILQRLGMRPAPGL